MATTTRICLFLLSLIATTLSAAEPPARPNILYCLADDWGWPHAGAYGDRVVKTPNFDRIAREGALFTHAFSASPSCTPSRAAMLTGQAPHRLREGGNLWGSLPKEFPVYTDLLQKEGYFVGLTRKGWGPGDYEPGGYAENPAGKTFNNFQGFFNKVPKGKPFCYWFGSHDPHREYVKGSGAKAGLKAADVQVPSYFPDTPEVRNDILDYYFAVQRFDRELGDILQLLEHAGQLENTLIVVTGDNGMPFPRCKANLYDGGTRQPLAVRWPARAKGGRTLDDFINLTDLAPTFLEAAGLKPPAQMTGRSFLGLLTGAEQPGARDTVFVERERHANVRKGDVGYPARAIRTKDFLFIWNLRPDRWPAGDPEMWKAVGAFGDCDNGPTKTEILKNPGSKLFSLAFGKRPEEELYDLKLDPSQMQNVAADAKYATAKKEMHNRLEKWMTDTKDPRLGGKGDEFETYTYYGPAK
jgi:N-sulfoglucosamine sulfohydrolase